MNPFHSKSQSDYYIFIRLNQFQTFIAKLTYSVMCVTDAQKPMIKSWLY